MLPLLFSFVLSPLFFAFLSCLWSAKFFGRCRICANVERILPEQWLWYHVASQHHSSDRWGPSRDPRGRNHGGCLAFGYIFEMLWSFGAGAADDTVMDGSA
jgi:hypothetical protein